MRHYIPILILDMPHHNSNTHTHTVTLTPTLTPTPTLTDTPTLTLTLTRTLSLTPTLTLTLMLCQVLALDEAHKYMDGAVTDGLSAAIVNVARLMRHDGIRLIVGTQSPLALAPELLDLVTIAVIHRFHSKDWFTYLKIKIPLHDNSFQILLELEPGEALVFTSRHQIGDKNKSKNNYINTNKNENYDNNNENESNYGKKYDTENVSENDNGNHDNIIPKFNRLTISSSTFDYSTFPYGHNIFKIKIRPRFTADIGTSAVNKTKSENRFKSAKTVFNPSEIWHKLVL